METKEMGFVAACKTFFGLKPGQTLTEFGKELRDLTDKDKADLRAMFPSIGIVVKTEGA